MKKNLIEFLEETMKAEDNGSVFTDLGECFMGKDAGVHYLLDLDKVLNSEKFQKLKEQRSLEDLYSGVRNAFDKPYDSLKSGEHKFSEALKLGKGDCMEKSTLFQVAMDYFRRTGNHPLSGERSFFIKGFMKSRWDPGFTGHAFNIIADGKKGRLIDLENPVSEFGHEVPYIVPALGIDLKHTGNIIIPREFSDGRTYTF